MFDFLFQDRNKEIQSLAEIIAVDMEKLNLSKLAIEKAIMMIAKAIAKSDILIQTESKEKRKKEYRLNVQPNDNECGTVFWTEVVKQLLTEQEALIIPLSGKYYRATSWSHTNEVMMKRVYKDVMLSCGDENLTIFSTFQSDEVIHLRYDNARIRLYLQNVVGQFDKTMDSINAMMQLSSQPRFKLKLGTNALSFREKQADGTDKVMTRDQYVLKIKKLLTSDDLEVLTEQENASVEQMQINTTVKAEELAKMALQINNEVANAFDIPEAVFNGNITEKSDATNEFITYAVSPIAEVINDTLTAYVVGENDYCRKNEKVMVWLARFKHVDVVDSAVNLDKLRGIGFHLDEIREMVGYPLLNTEFSTERALTKNYGGEGNSNAAQET
ncbi:phage portal protein [Ruminococcus sp. AF32-2AC]|jgi:HK97 family phage portal protein|nr:phage portal protein [Ruminococcus sp. AF32-2AC]UVY68350.1 MAG: portal protein [Bacteriophage sp.]DAE57888.1 MAG TPA: portal protein [Caudoviricetes sp.]